MILGAVVGAHGLRGELRIRLFGDGPEGLAAMPEVELAGERGLDDPEPRSYRVLRVAAGRGGEARIALEGVDGRDGAEALRGRRVIGDARHLEPLAAGEHRWFELIGCQVFPTEGDAPVGTVREIWETGAHDVLVVEDEKGQRHLLPAAKAFLREVDTAGRRIVYEMIPGLLDDPR